MITQEVIKKKYKNILQLKCFDIIDNLNLIDRMLREINRSIESIGWETIRIINITMVHGWLRVNLNKITPQIENIIHKYERLYYKKGEKYLCRH